MVAKAAEPRAKCIVCKTNNRYSRGLCRRCGDDARIVIRSGERTEQELIDKGLLLPRKGVGRPISSQFRKKLAKVS